MLSTLQLKGSHVEYPSASPDTYFGNKNVKKKMVLMIEDKGGREEDPW